jgi:drug/metabolite transporter (DMT)-like permease
LFVTALIGVFQTIAGLVGIFAGLGRTIRAEPQYILASVLFGIIASLMTILGVVSFTYPGADVGITTFLITLSIIPGGLIDWVFFGHRLAGRQWIGVLVFLLSGYAMLNFPSLDVLLRLPPWVWLTLGIAVLAAVNEGITQAAREMEAMAYNFWAGLTTVIFAGAWFMLADGWGAIPTFGAASFWFGAFAIAMIVVLMISFKIFAYRGGGSIALKKLVMQATYLIAATFAGWLAYHEPLTAGKIIGIAGFMVAFALADRGTWEFVSSRLPKTSNKFL